MSLRLSGGRRLESPPGETARPTTSRVRLAAMNLLAADLRGAAWLDLFCGSGVMACEALLRGASVVVAVEQDRRIAAVARRNLDLVRGGLLREGAPESGPRADVHSMDAIRWLQRGGPSSGAGGSTTSFDLIYADPPYRAGLYEDIVRGVAQGTWLRPGGTLVLECPSGAMPAVPAGWQERFRRRYSQTTLLGLKPLESTTATCASQASE